LQTAGLGQAPSSPTTLGHFEHTPRESQAPQMALSPFWFVPPQPKAFPDMPAYPALQLVDRLAVLGQLVVPPRPATVPPLLPFALSGQRPQLSHPSISDPYSSFPSVPSLALSGFFRPSLRGHYPASSLLRRLLTSSPLSQGRSPQVRCRIVPPRAVRLYRIRLRMTFGLRCSQPARRPHPASLPFRVPTVESLLRASFSFTSRLRLAFRYGCRHQLRRAPFVSIDSAHAGHSVAGGLRLPSPRLSAVSFTPSRTPRLSLVLVAPRSPLTPRSLFLGFSFVLSAFRSPRLRASAVKSNVGPVSNLSR
jgi:hypothetical protein